MTHPTDKAREALVLREGHFYQTRSFGVVGPLLVQKSAQYPWFILNVGSFDADGRFNGRFEDPKDLLTEDADMLSTAPAPLVRDEVLEEAAKACDEVSSEVSREARKANPYSEGFSDGGDECASRIRALKDKSTPPAEQPSDGDEAELHKQIADAYLKWPGGDADWARKIRDGEECGVPLSVVVSLLRRSHAPVEKKNGLPICLITGRVAGDRFACGDCDPCSGAATVPDVVKRLLSERDEFADKYEVLASHPKPSAPLADGEELREEPWVIRKRGAFYRANRSGYTVHVVAAGIYTREEAEREARIENTISARPLSEYAEEIELQRDRAQALLDKLGRTLSHLRSPSEGRSKPSGDAGLLEAAKRVRDAFDAPNTSYNRKAHLERVNAYKAFKEAIAAAERDQSNTEDTVTE